jgi:hypothetical protein
MRFDFSGNTIGLKCKFNDAGSEFYVDPKVGEYLFKYLDGEY